MRRSHLSRVTENFQFVTEETKLERRVVQERSLPGVHRYGGDRDCGGEDVHVPSDLRYVVHRNTRVRSPNLRIHHRIWYLHVTRIRGPRHVDCFPLLVRMTV